MKAKRVLILGCGYVGSAFAIAARASGCSVKAVTRNRSILDSLAGHEIEGFCGTLEEDDWFGFADSGFDWVLNCVSASEPGIEGYRKSYLDGNRKLARWMDESGFEGRAIYTSSVAVYPDRGGDWVKEEDARPHSDRAKLLLDAEAAFFDNGLTGVSTVLRLGGIYGPNRGFLAKRVQASGGKMPGFGDYYLNLVRLEDIVGAISSVFGQDAGKSRVYNVVDDEPMLRRHLVEGLSQALGIQSPTFDGNGASSRRWDGGAPANRRISNRAMVEDFDWQPKFPNPLQGMLDLL